jgi:hypothetical protein
LAIAAEAVGSLHVEQWFRHSGKPFQVVGLNQDDVDPRRRILVPDHFDHQQTPPVDAHCGRTDRGAAPSASLLARYAARCSAPKSPRCWITSVHSLVIRLAKKEWQAARLGPSSMVAFQNPA